MPAESNWTPPEVAQPQQTWRPPEAMQPAVASTSSPSVGVGEAMAPTDWNHLYSGLDNLNSNPTDSQKTAFDFLNAKLPDDKEAQAEAINREFVKTKFNLPTTLLDSNWGAVKDSYAKNELGMDITNISDGALYGAIGKHIQSGRAEAQDNQRKWETSTPVDKFDGSARWITKHGPSLIGVAWEVLNKPRVTLPESKLEKGGAFETALYASNPIAASLYDAEIINGVWNGGIKPALESMTSDIGVGTMFVGGGLAAAESTGSKLAAKALTAMKGFFGVVMAKSFAEQAPQVYKVLTDPKSTKEQKTAVIAGEAFSAYMAVHSSFSAVMDLLPIEKSTALTAKIGNSENPAEAANAIRVEANRVPPVLKPELIKAAEQLEFLFPEGTKPEVPVKVEAAAIRSADGTITEGINHASIKAEGQEGFTLSNGEFVTRNEALKVAEQSGQITEPLPEGTTELHSHMVDMPIKAETVKSEVESIDGAPANEHLSSVKKASVDAQLERMGFDPITPSERITWKSSVEESLKRFEKDSERGANLVRSIKNGQIRFSAEDVWDSQIYERQLLDEITAAEKRYDEALQNGDVIAIDAADQELYAKQAAYKDASMAFNEVMGSEAGRALNARKAMLREDYSLAALERKERKATGKVDIPDARQKELAEKSARITELEEQLKKSLESRAKARPPEEPRVKIGKVTPEILQRLSGKADEARARLMAKRGRATAGIDPTDIGDYALIVADALAKGAVKTAEISARLISEFGETIRPHVNDIIQAAKDAISAERYTARLEQRKAALETQIAELNRKIKEGDLSTKAQKVNRPAVEEIEKLIQERDEASQTLKGMREEASKIKTLEEAIAEKQRKLAEGDLAVKNKAVNRPSTRELEVLRQERDALNEELALARKLEAKPTDAEILQKKVDAIQEKIAAKREQLKTGDFAVKEKAADRPQVREIEEAKQELEKLNKEIAEARKGPPATKEESALKAWRTRTEKEIARLEARLPKPESVPLELPYTPEDLKLKEKINSLKKDVAAEFRKSELERRPLWLKGAEKVAWVGETAILTSLGIFLKIPISAFWKIVTGLPKSVVGVVAGKLFPEAAKFAQMQVQPTWLSMLAGETQAVKETFTTGMRAAREAFQNRLTTEETLYVPDSLPPEAKDWIRSVHKGLHLPAQINEFVRVVSAKENNLKAMGFGDTLQDPAVWTSIRVAAYEEAKRAAYLEKDSLMSGIVQNTVRFIERKGKELDMENAAALVTMAIELDNPVKNVPINIISQTGEAMTGSLTGTLEIFNAYRKGFEKMKPDDLNRAFRRIKSGSVGAAAMIGAWYAYKEIGGSKVGGAKYGTEEKGRKPDEPKEGQVRIGGAIMPEMGFHNETWAAAQMVASYHHLLDAQYGPATVEKNADAFLRVVLGPVSEVPGIKQSIASKLAETTKPMKSLGQWAASRAVPSGVAQIARWLDTKGDMSFETFMKKPTQRYPRGFVEEFKTRIPGLRTEVPTYRDTSTSYRK